jgi:small subunit ribosomal protein S18
MSGYYRRKKGFRTVGDNGNAHEVDYKDVEYLKGFIGETAKIVPARITCTQAKQQREISKAIKLARFLALLPYCDSHR